jgi:hypothetical protein
MKCAVEIGPAAMICLVQAFKCWYERYTDGQDSDLISLL